MADRESSTLLSCHDLEVGHRGRAILPPIDAAIGAGEFWVVIGRNGAGKSTWFKTMVGLLPPIRGAVRHRDPSLRIGYVPQRSALDALFPVSARDVVRMGVDRGRSFLGISLRDPPAVKIALEDTGAAELSDRPFRDLSEGQKARVLLARMVAGEPQIALLDEPTAALDIVAERQAFDYLESLRVRKGTTIVVVSHFLGIAHEFATKAVFLDRDCGTVVAGDPDDVFGHADFHRSYGAAAAAISEPPPPMDPR